MITKQKKNNGVNLEEIRLRHSSSTQGIAVMPKTSKDAVKIIGVENDVGSKKVAVFGLDGKPVYLVSRDVVVGLRKYNETHKDKIHYEVL